MILAKTKKATLLSELSTDEINLCSQLYVISDVFDNKVLGNFLAKFLRLRVSKSRQGRKELLSIAKSIKEEPEKFSRLKRIFGGFG
jgi:hypothetical protein